MKKNILKSITYFLIITTFISCGSTPKREPQEPQIEQKTNTKRELKVLNSQNKQVEKTEPTEVDFYKDKIEGIIISSISAPKETSKNKAFSQPYSFKVTKNDNPVPNFQLSISYPESKKNDIVNFGLEVLTTDESGIVTFNAPIPKSTFNSFVKVYPDGNVTNSQIAELADKVSVSVPYKVKSNLLYSGGTISIVDFAQSGKPITNNSVSSSLLLMSLMKLRFTRIGNVDFSTEILNGDSAALYKAAKTLLGNNSSFLIYGTVKYESPITKDDSGKFSCTLIGKITCINMKDGAILYETEKKVSVLEDKDWNCLPKAREKLAEEFATSILYGI